MRNGWPAGRGTATVGRRSVGACVPAPALTHMIRSHMSGTVHECAESCRHEIGRAVQRQDQEHRPCVAAGLSTEAARRARAAHHQRVAAAVLRHPQVVIAVDCVKPGGEEGAKRAVGQGPRLQHAREPACTTSTTATSCAGAPSTLHSPRDAAAPWAAAASRGATGSALPPYTLFPVVPPLTTPGQTAAATGRAPGAAAASRH